MNDDLYSRLIEYSQSEMYPFHMPGHKRHSDGSLIPYQIDLTEIEGFDNLHHPEGCIREIEKKAEALLQVKRAFLLVNGATGGILAAIRSMTKPGDTVLIARNCHRSVYNAVELCGLNAEYIYPKRLEKYPTVCASVTEEEVYEALQKHPDTKLVVLTSPTYEGVGSDLALISEICYNCGAKLFVDEAHGAHLYFDRKTVTAMAAGADVSVVSLHKTLPSLTQTALLLTNDESIEGLLQANLSVFETSSPSYVLMSSVDQCLKKIEQDKSLFKAYEKRLEIFYKRTKNLCYLNLLFNHLPDSVYDYDKGKLVIMTTGTNLSGHDLAAILRDEYKLETEMSACDYVIAMTSVCDTDEGFNRLADALAEIDKRITSQLISQNSVEEIRPEKAYNSCNCFRHNAVVKSLTETAGTVSHEDIFAYPPGIPLVVKGELITEAILNEIKRLEQSGVNIISSLNTYPNGLIVSDFN